ncbi:hypothetical protein CK489_36720 [Bradyrhizobium sp. UFLA03-84]|nr:hypothetical protein CK489_36720 [Bradyrhizobium sp. UFLA03-84]
MVFAMTSSPNSPIEAFVVPVSLAPHSVREQFVRVGYRAGQHDVIASVDVPIHLLEREIASHLEMVTRFNLSGQFVSHLLDSVGSPLPTPRSTASIEQLVSEAVCSENLKLEEVTPNDLRGLLMSLEVAIDQVRAALIAISVSNPTTAGAS